jgi:hypothetical protein
MKKNKKENAFKVIVKDADDVLKAEYVFTFMKEAIMFESGVRKNGYRTAMERISI